MKFRNPFRNFYFLPTLIFVLVILIILAAILFTAKTLLAEENSDTRFLKEEQRFAQSHPGYCPIRKWELPYLKKALPEGNHVRR